MSHRTAEGGMSTDAVMLENAYRSAGIEASVKEISPGRYELTKQRGCQTISHRELKDEIDRLAKAKVRP